MYWLTFCIHVLQKMPEPQKSLILTKTWVNWSTCIWNSYLSSLQNWSFEPSLVKIVDIEVLAFFVAYKHNLLKVVVRLLEAYFYFIQCNRKLSFVSQMPPFLLYFVGHQGFVKGNKLVLHDWIFKSFRKGL